VLLAFVRLVQLFLGHERLEKMMIQLPGSRGMPNVADTADAKELTAIRERCELKENFFRILLCA
jgi:hypothetical protein